MSRYVKLAGQTSGGGFVLPDDLTPDSVTLDNLCNKTTGCVLGQWELIDYCENWTMTCTASFDYKDLGTKYDLICFSKTFNGPDGGCTCPCLRIRMNSSCTVANGCNSCPPYITGCYHCTSGMAFSCTCHIGSSNCHLFFKWGTYVGMLYPVAMCNVNIGADTGDDFTVGYDIHMMGTKGYYGRPQGLNRGYLMCGCGGSSWSQFSGLNLTINCASCNRPGSKYVYWGRKCLTIPE